MDQQPRSLVLLADLQRRGKHLPMSAYMDYERLRKRLEDAVLKNLPTKCLALVALLRYLQELGPHDPAVKSLMNLVLELAAMLGCGGLLVARGGLSGKGGGKGNKNRNSGQR